MDIFDRVDINTPFHSLHYTLSRKIARISLRLDTRQGYSMLSLLFITSLVDLGMTIRH